VGQTLVTRVACVRRSSPAFDETSHAEARSASASTDSPSAAEPTTSQNRTVTTLRCSRDRPSDRAPHSGQNLKETSALYPHSGQLAMLAV
jgi:hypothetical protein